MPLHNKSSYPRYHCYLMTKKRFIAFHSPKSYYFYQCQKIQKNAKNITSSAPSLHYDQLFRSYSTGKMVHR